MCSLGICCIFSLILVTALVDGECHEDLNQYGCKPSFHIGDAVAGCIMLLVDAGLFAIFCYRWYKLISIFRGASSMSNNNETVINLTKSFYVQFGLTLTAIISCFIDVCIQLSYQDYSTLVIYCVDVAIVASCNFALIKESQTFMFKYFCWCCKIPSYLTNSIITNSNNTPINSPRGNQSPHSPNTQHGHHCHHGHHGEKNKEKELTQTIQKSVVTTNSGERNLNNITTQEEDISGGNNIIADNKSEDFNDDVAYDMDTINDEETEQP